MSLESIARDLRLKQRAFLLRGAFIVESHNKCVVLENFQNSTSRVITHDILVRANLCPSKRNARRCRRRKQEVAHKYFHAMREREEGGEDQQEVLLIERLHAALESLLRLRVRFQWVAKCFHALKEARGGGNNNNNNADAVDEKLALVYDQFMYADVNVACDGSTVLPSPEDLKRKERHETFVQGRFALQIDEVADVGKPFSSRYESANTSSSNNGGFRNLQSRCLKMNATDGKHRYVLYEYSAIPALDAVETKAGCKVALIDPKVVNGCLYVDKDRLVVLGGQVMRLEAARQRMLKKWREPNRPEELTGESANRREACEKAAWGRSGGAQQQQRQQQQQQQAPPNTPRNQQHQQPAQHHQEEQHQQNRNAIIELDLDDEDEDGAPDEVEVIPNTQLEDGGMGRDVEEIEVAGEEEEEEMEIDDDDVQIARVERPTRRKHVILSSSEDPTQTTQNNNDGNRTSVDAPTTGTTTNTNSTNRSLSALTQSEEFRIAVEVQKNATNGLWSYISCIKRLRRAKVGKPDDKRTIVFNLLAWITRVESIALKPNGNGGYKWRAKIMLQDSTHYLTVWIKNDHLDPFTECTVDEYASFSASKRAEVQKTFQKNCFQFCGVVLVEALKYEREGEGHPSILSILHDGKLKKNLLTSLQQRCEKTPFV